MWLCILGAIFFNLFPLVSFGWKRCISTGREIEYSMAKWIWTVCLWMIVFRRQKQWNYYNHTCLEMEDTSSIVYCMEALGIDLRL